MKSKINLQAKHSINLLLNLLISLLIVMHYDADILNNTTYYYYYHYIIYLVSIVLPAFDVFLFSLYQYDLHHPLCF